MTRAARERMPDWLILAQEEWDEVERRNQLLVRALAERHPRVRFLFCETPLRSREIGRWRPPRPRQVEANVWAVRPVRPLPGARLGPLSDRLEAVQVRAAMRALGMVQPILWTQDPRAADLVELLPAARLVYDLTDDWAAFEADPDRRAAVQSSIERLGRRADVVFACSRPLEHGARAWSDRVHYLPNGVDPPGAVGKAPPELEALPRPRLGYAGTLHPSRVDVDLLAAAAELRPAWSFVLMGPDQLEEAQRRRLLALPNVHYLGVHPHAEVRAHLEALDVCLVPHLDTEFTRSLDPLKIYEYLAAGRPVIATPVGNVPDLAEHVTVAATAQDLVRVAEAELERDSPERVAARRGAVADATWEARAQDVETALGVELEASERSGGGELCAVIVSYNTRDLLERCLTDLRTHAAGLPLHTVVVDNGSSDGSVRMVGESFPEVALIELGENAGFARANNAAFERCRGEFVLLLNSDAFVHPGAVQALVDAARRHPRAAVVGPRLLNPDGTLQRSAWPFPHAGRILLESIGLHRPLRRMGFLEDLGTWQHDEEWSVDFLIGACLLIRFDALAEVGGFDEDFWLYGEEADLERRMADRGWEVVFTPGAVVTHVGGASSSVSAVRLRHFYSGQRRFLIKHGSRLAWPLARLALLVGSLLRGRWAAARIAIEWDRGGMRPTDTIGRRA